jgi:hypothetical protein
MGYDMRWRKADPDEAAAAAEAQKIFNAACGKRDALPKSERGVPNLERAKRERIDLTSEDAYDGMSRRYRAAADQVHAAYAAMNDAERSYFRLNIHGMGRYRNLMEDLGMAFEDDPQPPFPKPEDHGTSWEDIEAAEYPEDHAGFEWTDSRLVAALKHVEAANAVLAFHGKADTPGIPLHKFGSNDGWIVVPAECEAAVRIWRGFVATEGEDAALNYVANKLGEGNVDYWLKWIAYLAGAARHDGFEVH